MKSQIHENKKSRLLSLSKKVLMLIAVLFGTAAMANANTLPSKTVAAKEVKMTKHPKHKSAKTEKKSATAEPAVPKAK